MANVGCQSRAEPPIHSIVLALLMLILSPVVIQLSPVLQSLLAEGNERVRVPRPPSVDLTFERLDLTLQLGAFAETRETDGVLMRSATKSHFWLVAGPCS